MVFVKHPHQEVYDLQMLQCLNKNIDNFTHLETFKQFDCQINHSSFDTTQHTCLLFLWLTHIFKLFKLLFKHHQHEVIAIDHLVTRKVETLAASPKTSDPSLFFLNIKDIPPVVTPVKTDSMTLVLIELLYPSS